MQQIETTVQWTDSPVQPNPPPASAQAVYRGLDLEAHEAGTAGYASWRVSCRLVGLDIVAHAFGKMTLNEGKAAAIAAADRLLAAGAEPREAVRA